MFAGNTKSIDNIRNFSTLMRTDIFILIEMQV